MRSYSMQYGGSGLAFLSRRLLRVLVLFLPTAILSGAALQTDGDAQITLWLGTGFQVLVCFFGFLSPWSRQQPMGPAVITLYLIALGWLWWGGGESEDWFMHLSRAVLLVIPMLVFGFVTLTESGAPALRRARILAQRLANRKDWPVSFVECKNLPEVKALREALYIDATPALALLQNQ